MPEWEYDQALYVDGGAADLWDLQAAYGYRSGIPCTVHAPSHLEQFMLGVDGDDLPEDSAGRLRLTAAVQLLTVYAQSAMQGIFTPTPAGAPVVLDDSELTTIRLAKGARTVHQIGEMVSISSAEVQRNLRQVTRKLGVSSVSAAVLRCIKDGLIA